MQGPPGTGKTSAIIAIISALLAKHYTPPLKHTTATLSAQRNCDIEPNSADRIIGVNSGASEAKAKAKDVTANGSNRQGKPRNEEAQQFVGKAKGRSGDGPARAERAVALPKFRVLVCAQSNAAIDEVIGRLANPGLLTGSLSISRFAPA